MSKHSLILGTATNLPAEHFLPFLRSLRAAGYDGRVCLFVAQMEEAEVEELAELADEIVRVDGTYPALVPGWVVAALQRVKSTRGARRFYPGAFRLALRALRAPAGSPRARDLEYRMEGIMAHRYWHYRNYLLAQPDVDQVMISDVRDVLFQGDPFEAPCDGLEVFLEDPQSRVWTEGFNSTWLRDLYGQEGLDQLGDVVVSCAGVTVGRRQPMIEYFGVMIREVDKQMFPLGPHDQAIHNWVLRTGQVPDARFVPNGAGRVQTMGALRQVDVGEDGSVLNPDGSRPAVLHQYDRHVELAPVLLERLAP